MGDHTTQQIGDYSNPFYGNTILFGCMMFYDLICNCLLYLCVTLYIIYTNYCLSCNIYMWCVLFVYMQYIDYLYHIVSKRATASPTVGDLVGHYPLVN